MSRSQTTDLHVEAFTFVQSAGWNITEILEYRPDGTVLFLGERPCSTQKHELVTTPRQVCIHVA